jgi:alpha-amylase
VAAFLLLAASAIAGSTADWKKRTVYQLLTDRFKRSNGDSYFCDLHNYCGGDFMGIQQQL